MADDGKPVAPANDAFGEPLKAVEVKPGETPPAPAAKDEEKGEQKFVEVEGKKFVDDGTGKPKLDKDGKPEPFVEKKPEGGGTDDIENHPVVLGLKAQIDAVKEEMGGNLSGQREVIERLEKALKDAREGKAPDGIEPLFKDIKHVKDLPADEQEKMTDTEKRLFDELADMKELQNKNHASAAQKEIDAKTQAEKDSKDAMKTVIKTAQAEALRLAGNKKDVANQIIENFNLFKENEKLSEAQVKERVEKAANMIQGFKPVKEQRSPQGKPAAADKQGDDPHGIQGIVDGIGKNRDGGYAL